MSEKFSIEDAKDVVCSCGCKLYKPVVSLKEVSPLQSGKPYTSYAPVGGYACIKCDKLFEIPSIIA